MNFSQYDILVGNKFLPIGIKCFLGARTEIFIQKSEKCGSLIVAGWIRFGQASHIVGLGGTPVSPSVDVQRNSGAGGWTISHEVSCANFSRHKSKCGRGYTTRKVMKQHEDKCADESVNSDAKMKKF